MLNVAGVFLLVFSLVGVVFGVYMSSHPKTRGPGRMFALWWVPLLVAAGGVFLRDPVTFAVGVLCFIVAGVAFILEYGGGRRNRARREPGRRSSGANAGSAPDVASIGGTTIGAGNGAAAGSRASRKVPKASKWEKKRRRSQERDVRRREAFEDPPDRAVS